MEKLLVSNNGRVTSIQAVVNQVIRQSRIAPTPNNSPPPVAHQIMSHLQRRLRIKVPNISPVPLDSTAQPPEFLQPPQNALPSASQQLKVSRGTKCKSVPAPVQQVEMCGEQLCQNRCDKCNNSLISEQVKVKDLMNLVNEQGSEVRKMNERLEWHDTMCGGMESYLRGEIIRLNGLVFYYQKNEEEDKIRIAKHEEKGKMLEAALKDCLEFMQNVNFDFKKNVKKVTDKYCEGSSELEELEQGQVESESSSGSVNETKSLIEQVELEKSKFRETTFVLVELTDIGFQECSKRNEQLEAENAELRKLEPHVSKIHLRKVKGSEEIGSGGESEESLSPPHSSASRDREWSIVPLTEENESVDGFENGESLECETPPPPVLYPFNEETNEASGERDELSLNKLKRKRITDGSGNDYHDDVLERSKRGGKKKAGKSSERKNPASKLIGGKELSVNRDLGECITLHYSERNEDVEKAGMTTEEVNNQEDVVMDDMSSSSSSGDQEESYKDYGALSDLFCKTCCTPCLNKQKLAEHLIIGCSTERMSYTESSHVEEDDLPDV